MKPDQGPGCTDDDECLLNVYSCSEFAECQNTQGSYECTCHEGFVGNGVECRDINECLTNNGGCDSNAQCINTEGSFKVRITLPCEIIEINSTIKGIIIINNKNSYIQRDNLFIEMVDDSCDTLVRSAIATLGSEGTATPVRTSTNAPTTTPFARMATASIILDRFDASARWASCTPTRATSRRASI